MFFKPKKQLYRWLCIVVLFLAVAFLVAISHEHYVIQYSPATPTSPDLKVAFIADQGLGPDAEAVLALIKSEGADMVLHQGDFDYMDNPDAWDQQIDKILGPGFPYFASIGNHDIKRWSDYQQKLKHRLDKIPDSNCIGEVGVNSVCHYKGLFFVLSGIGTHGYRDNSYLQQQLLADHSRWKICSWHKNQNSMQLGSKPDEVGWKVYEACRQAGAIIVTGHEHSYQRSKALNNIRVSTVDASCEDDPSTPDIDVCVGKGSTFVVVSGLGGKSIREQKRCFPVTYPYGCNGEWAKIYTSSQNAQYGALFITFNVDGDSGKAVAYFKNIDGVVIDSFVIKAR